MTISSTAERAYVLGQLRALEDVKSVIERREAELRVELAALDQESKE